MCNLSRDKKFSCRGYLVHTKGVTESHGYLSEGQLMKEKYISIAQTEGL